MRILLINPKGLIRDYPSMGLAYIGAVLVKERHSVRVCDQNFTDEDPFGAIDQNSPEVLGISCLSTKWNDALKLARYAKRRNPKTIVVVGGPHISMFGEEALREAGGNVDYGIKGDGEFSFLSLLKLLAKKPKADIPGLIWRGKKGFTPTFFIEDLDSLPFPDYTLEGLGRLERYPLLTSRGCPFNCLFCSAGRVSGKKWRSRGPSLIIRELKHAKSFYGATSFHIMDDNFTLNVDRAKRFCRMLLRERINLPWECNNGIRADRLDEELVALMKKSGCREIAFGVESGDPEVFARINKGEKLEDIERAVALVKRYRIKVQGFFIIGLPGATLDSEYKSIAFAKKMGLDSAGFGMAIPFRGTGLREWVDGNARLYDKKVEKNHSPAYSLITPPYYETREFGREDRMKAFALANLRFGSYWLGRTPNKLKAISILLKAIWKYDPLRAPAYFWDILTRKILGRAYSRLTGKVARTMRPL
jgi:anaerobic magnesium-protoporphyrin IX monomethyl ester cyclase